MATLPRKMLDKKSPKTQHFHWLHKRAVWLCTILSSTEGSELKSVVEAFQVHTGEYLFLFLGCEQKMYISLRKKKLHLFRNVNRLQARVFKNPNPVTQLLSPTSWSKSCHLKMFTGYVRMSSKWFYCLVVTLNFKMLRLLLPSRGVSSSLSSLTGCSGCVYKPRPNSPLPLQVPYTDWLHLWDKHPALWNQICAQHLPVRKSMISPF